MPNYKSPGTENLRARPKVMTSTPIDSPGGGEDAGGRENMRADGETRRAKELPAGSRGGYDYKVRGVQSFPDGRV